MDAVQCVAFKCNFEKIKTLQDIWGEKSEIKSQGKKQIYMVIFLNVWNIYTPLSKVKAKNPMKFRLRETKRKI